MDIGGNDLIIETTLQPATQRQLLLRYLQMLWPGGVLEEDPTEPGDFFYYKTPAVKASWDEHGRTDANAPDMVYALFGEGGLTVVHEGLNEQEIRMMFFDNRMFV